jgi:hypothetical protein
LGERLRMCYLNSHLICGGESLPTTAIAARKGDITQLVCEKSVELVHPRPLETGPRKWTVHCYPSPLLATREARAELIDGGELAKVR